MKYWTVGMGWLFLAVAGFGMKSELPNWEGPPEGFSEAEAFVEEGAWAEALSVYRAMETNGLDAAAVAWHAFRVQDLTWRNALASQHSDNSRAEQAVAALNRMLEARNQPEEQGRLFAEILESLGDHAAQQNPRYPRPHNGWSFYQRALDAWAGSTDLETARDRYLHLIRKAALPDGLPDRMFYGSYGTYIPESVIDRGLRIAKAREDRAFLTYLKVKTLVNAYQPATSGDLLRSMEQALELARGSDWEDDLLWTAANFWEQRGAYTTDERGQWTLQPDYEKAVELYREIRKRFARGESRWWDDAGRRIEGILEPSLNVRIHHVFSPQSLPSFTVDSRNLKTLHATLVAIDLTRDVRYTDDQGTWDWKDAMALNRRKSVRTLHIDTEPDLPHAPFRKEVGLETPLPPGAYLLSVRSGGEEARELLLVSDTVALSKQLDEDRVLIWVTDAVTGEPKPDHTVRLFTQWSHQRTTRWTSASGHTGPDGTVELPVGDHPGHRRASWIASSGDDGNEQSFCTLSLRGVPSPQESMKFYIVTDRPAYRPGDTLHWKLTARRPSATGYDVPADQTLGLVLRDQRGKELWRGTQSLNAFGSAWGELPLTSEMALGMIRLEIRDEKHGGRHLASESIARLEEYKLPEYKVSVELPKEDGSPKVFRIGDTVEAVVQADYYYGEPVAGAEVEAVVRMTPVHGLWQPPRPYDWLYPSPASEPFGGFGSFRGGHHQRGQEVKRETLKTDAAGRAVIEIPTANYGRQTLEFTIEARVVDASRREVRGSGSVRVSPTSHRAVVEVDEAIHAPGDRMRVRVHTRDANDRPVGVKGRLTVKKKSWREVWLSPRGEEVFGRALQAEKDSVGVWPPSPPPRLPPWRPIRKDYEETEVFSTELTTGDDGEVSASFTLEEAGYYSVYWLSERTTPMDVVEASEEVWVAEPDTLFTGWHSGPVRIVADRSAFEEGGEAVVMIHCDVPGRTLLFLEQAETVMDYRLIRMEGEAKLLRIPITARHVPNFGLEAHAIGNRQWHRDNLDIRVPPVERFLDVSLTFDQSTYQPGETGEIHVVVRDVKDRPVEGEVTLSALDESVLYIQEELSGDPRTLFYGHQRPFLMNSRVGFHDRSYVHAVPREERRTAHNEEAGAKGQVVGMSMDRGVFSGRATGGRVAPSASQMAFGGGSELVMAEAAMDTEALAAPDAAGAEITVRQNFRDTLAWMPDLVTGETGEARATVTFPDQLTTWKARAVAADVRSRFGLQATNTVSTLPLVLRMQQPRFLVAGDEAVLSANVHNRAEEAQQVVVTLKTEGLDHVGSARQTVRLEPDEQRRVDWTVRAETAGEATVTMTALGDLHADAMQRSLSVVEHGMMRRLTVTARAETPETTLVLDLPAERREGSTSMMVQVAPSLAVTMLDALPYLIQYPYGCVEQTLSRFLPAVLVRKTLSDQGLNPEDITDRIFGGVEREHVASTHTAHEGLDALDQAVEQGLTRLADFQHADGGWGWWKEGATDDYMTAYVLWGLSAARDAGVDVDKNSIRRAVHYLRPRLVEYEDRPHQQAWMLFALSQTGFAADTLEYKAMDRVYEQRKDLSAYGRALLALTLHHRDDARLESLVRQLPNGARIDESPDRSALIHGSSTDGSTAPAIAWWGKDRGFRRWYQGGIEATAFSILALLEADPDHELIEPAVMWLVRNRRGANWSNTKDTAIAVLALNRYLQIRREGLESYTYELRFNGKALHTGAVTAETLLRAPSRIPVPEEWIRDGTNRLAFTRTSGEGRPFLSTHAEFFSLEEPIPASGHEVFVVRRYFLEEKIPTLLEGHRTRWIPLRDGDALSSGDRVQVVITVEAKNDLEYMIFEDRKPAGLEAVQIQSGEPMTMRQVKEPVIRHWFAEGEDPDLSSAYTGQRRSLYQELRDRHVAAFADRLPQGYWTYRYLLRAETPGRFHALPVTAEAMYIPEIQANGAEIRLEIKDRKE